MILMGLTFGVRLNILGQLEGVTKKKPRCLVASEFSRPVRPRRGEDDKGRDSLVLERDGRQLQTRKICHTVLVRYSNKLRLKMKMKMEKDIKKKQRRGGTRAAYQGSQSDCRRRPSDWTTERAAGCFGGGWREGGLLEYSSSCSQAHSWLDY